MTEFERLLNECKSAVERFVNFKIASKSDAEDILQDVYLCAFEKFSDLKNKGSFKAWIISIAKNRCNDHYRKSMTCPDISIDELPESAVVSDCYGIIEQSPVPETMRLLERKDEQILRLFYIDGHRQREISKILDIPLGTVKSRLHTARKNFKAMYLSQNTDILKGDDIMSKSIMPEHLPPYKITETDKEPFAVKWEELMGWFIVPKLGKKLNWAMYDIPSRKRSHAYDMNVTGKAVVHSIEGVEITAREASYSDKEDTINRIFVAQLTDTHCRYLAAVRNDGGIKNYITFLDDNFVPAWGFGEDNCGNEINLSSKGDIKREGNTITCADKEFLLDIAGRYRVEINGKCFDTVCVMDIEAYGCGVISEQYIDKNGRTVLWRRFNRNDWAKEQYKRDWTQMLPDNERIFVNGEVYVHWYDCITDYIL